MQTKENKKKPIKTFVQTLTKLPLKTKIIFLLILVAIVGLILFPVLSKNEEGSFTVISESSLQEILEINELGTVEYDYNAVAECVDDKGNVKYYVAYEGEVTAGIDFKKISFDIDSENKIIKIIVPAVEIQNRTVKMESLDFIFTKSKYETETVTQEAYKLCIENLEQRTANSTLIQDSAKTNAISAVEALFEPWIKTMDEQYTIDVVYGG